MKNKVVILVLFLIVFSLAIFFVSKKNEFEKNYSVKCDLVSVIKDKKELDKIYNTKSTIIFIGNNKTLSVDYAKALKKVSSDYNKEFYYYSLHNGSIKIKGKKYSVPVVIGKDNKKVEETVTSKTNVKKNIDNLFLDVTSGSCDKDSDC